MLLNQLRRLKEMDKHIRKGNTGNAKCLSQKLKISRRQLYNYIDELKDIGVLIKYCRNKKTFYYDKECKVIINCKIEFLNDENTINLLGGRKIGLCNVISQSMNSFVSASPHRAKMYIGNVWSFAGNNAE